MVQGGLKKVQGGLEPPLAPHFPRLCSVLSLMFVNTVLPRDERKNCTHSLIRILRGKENLCSNTNRNSASMLPE